MPRSIPPGLTKEHVLKALADLDTGIDHPFGTPTGYEVVHGGKRYPPKAVVGLACRYLLGRVLRPDEFNGGEAPGQANFVLRKLGFSVVTKGEAVEQEDEKQARSDWSGQEVRPVTVLLVPEGRQALMMPVASAPLPPGPTLLGASQR